MPEEFELPPAFHAVDEASIGAQSSFLASTRAQLTLLVLAGGIGAFSWVVGDLEVAALAAGLAFLGAAGLRLLLVRRRLHRRWYEGRAAAESLKTLAWRYSVGGEPFALRTQASRESFSTQARGLFEGLESLDAVAPSATDLDPTPSMETLRGSDLEARRLAYSRGRLDDQLSWYSMKADWNRGRARFWSLAVLALQLGGAAGAFLRGFGLFGLDLFGLAAALAASGAAWLETKQHASLASAYRVAADELASIRQLAQEPTTEEAWARFVGEAEAAVSREHTMWKATSSRLRPASLA